MLFAFNAHLLTRLRASAGAARGVPAARAARPRRVARSSSRPAHAALAASDTRPARLLSQLRHLRLSRLSSCGFCARTTRWSAASSGPRVGSSAVLELPLRLAASRRRRRHRADEWLALGARLGCRRARDRGRIVVAVPVALLRRQPRAGAERIVDESRLYSAAWADYLATGGRLHYAAWSAPFFDGRTPLFPGRARLDARRGSALAHRERGRTGAFDDGWPLRSPRRCALVRSRAARLRVAASARPAASGHSRRRPVGPAVPDRGGHPRGIRRRRAWQRSRAHRTYWPAAGLACSAW